MKKYVKYGIGAAGCLFILLLACYIFTAPEFNVDYLQMLHLAEGNTCGYILTIRAEDADISEIAGVEAVPAGKIKSYIIENEIVNMEFREEALEVEGRILFDSQRLSAEDMKNQAFLEKVYIVLKNGRKVKAAVSF